jgi:hypothetical protein
MSLRSQLWLPRWPLLSRYRLRASIAVATSVILSVALWVQNEPIIQTMPDLFESFGLAGRIKGFDAADTAYQKGEYASALRQLRPLAERGDERAQYTLGLMYSTGRGVPRDDHVAVKLFSLAADQGHSHARSRLGFMYSRGYGVPQDYTQAAWFYRLAADQGCAEAQFELGLLYAEGDRLSQDYVSAHMWFNLAAASFPAAEIRNRRSAIANREAVESKMTRAEIIEAQRLAREWAKMIARSIPAQF